MLFLPLGQEVDDDWNGEQSLDEPIISHSQADDGRSDFPPDSFSATSSCDVPQASGSL